MSKPEARASRPRISTPSASLDVECYGDEGPLHEERRPRKLLLHKREIERLRKLSQEKGVALIPLSIYLNAKGIAKVRIGAGRGKKAYDKRAALKTKEAKRAMHRAQKDE